MKTLLLLMVLARDPKPIEDPKTLAEKYLVALGDGHDQSGKDYLLGGLTLDAVTASALLPELAGQSPKRVEDGSLKDAAEAVSALDSATASLDELSLADAKRLVEKTKALQKTFAKKLPVFADVIRVDRPLYWNKRNPMRVLLEEAGREGTYHLEYVPFTAKSRDSDGKTKTWPLRIVRFKSGTIDTGWKVLPASEWDPQ